MGVRLGLDWNWIESATGSAKALACGGLILDCAKVRPWVDVDCAWIGLGLALDWDWIGLGLGLDLP